MSGPTDTGADVDGQYEKKCQEDADEGNDESGAGYLQLDLNFNVFEDH